MVLRTPLRCRALLAAPALPLASPALAQSWPDRPLRLVIAFPAGSLTDVLGRLLAEPLGKRLGQPVVVDNRAGGNGTVGTIAVQQAAPDGNTVLIISTSAASVNLHIIRRLPFDPVRDFTHIGAIAEAPYLLVVPAGSPDATLAQFLDRARASPAALTFSHGHARALIMTEVMARHAGVRLTAVPYRGGAEALTDLGAGRIDYTFTNFANGLAQSQGVGAQGGRVRGIAQSAGQRTPLAPEVPPVANVVPGYDINVWFGLSAPVGTPEPMVRRWNEALNGALRDEAVVWRLRQLGFLPFTQTPEQFGLYIRTQLATWGELVRIAGVEPQ
ncbi:MAG: tripartite tricarboxylate transporter substrate binding protein [Roseococcus sp.]